MKLLVAFVMALVVGGCSKSSGLSGTYVAQVELRPGETMEMAEYEFSPAGKALVKEAMTGMAVELDYEIEGDRLKLRADGAGAAQVFTINEDGSLQGPMGMRIVKKKS